jgi:hypothetical protein
LISRSSSLTNAGEVAVIFQIGHAAAVCCVGR